MTRALLINPPQHCLEEALRIWTFSHAANFPLALFRLSTYLKSLGHEVDVIDAFNIHPNIPESYVEALGRDRIARTAPCGNFDVERRTKNVYHIGLSWEDLETRLSSLDPPSDVFISSVFTWSWKTTHRTIEMVSRIFPEASIRLGGIYPTLCPQKASESGARVVEGRLEELDGVWLDADLLTEIDYLDGIVIKTSVGCPNACSYCAVHVLEGRQVLFRDPSDVLDELDSLAERLHIERVFFWESNLLFEAKNHAERIFEGVAKRKPPFVLKAPEGIQPGLMTPGLARLMKASGFREIRLTLETTDPEMTSRLNRPGDISDVENAISDLLEAGFDVSDISVVLLVGQPKQTIKAILKDILRVYKLGTKTSFLVYTPIPRTADFIRYKELIRNRPLEDLDSFLFPLASSELGAADLDTLMAYFGDRYFPPKRIAGSVTDDTLIRAMQEMMKEGAP